ncbi:MAG: AraC family transcriptional regulator [Ruminococcaceae bacterium]|nr:AraC family transcriptional regulator [Oscillospiraceae bacterium]
MDWIIGIQKAIDYIEANITEDINYEDVAKASFSSSYHFQRVFSILCGYTLGEYIRNRRLSLAAADLAVRKEKVIDVALKYGYESPESFSKAFRKFHGITPSQARSGGSTLRSFPKLSIKISLEGGIIMDYQIVNMPEITVTGYSEKFNGSPKDKYQQMHDLMVDGNVRFIRYSLQGMATDVTTEHIVVSDISDSGYLFTIGSIIPKYFTEHLEETAGEYAEKLHTLKIPAHTYVKAETERGVTFMDNYLKLYQQVIGEWLPNSDYTLSAAPEIAITHRFKENKDGCYVELFLPVEKK